VTPVIFAVLQVESGQAYRHDYDAAAFVSMPRAGELFRLGDPGDAVATIERVVWRQEDGSVELYLRAFGSFTWTAEQLAKRDWSEGEWWTPEAPG
jgi:hypothetical protein